MDTSIVTAGITASERIIVTSFTHFYAAFRITVRAASVDIHTLNEMIWFFIRIIDMQTVLIIISGFAIEDITIKRIVGNTYTATITTKSIVVCITIVELKII